MHRKVDRWVDLLHALSARHTHPMFGRERTIRHILRCECEGAEALQEAHDKVPRFIEREFLSKTDTRAAVERRIHEWRRGDFVEECGVEPSLGTEHFGVGAPEVRSFVCEEGGHHDLCLGREVELACAWDDERFVNGSARYEWG